MQGQPLPDFFDSMAVMCKFVVVEKADPEFFEKHYHAIQITVSVIGVLAGEHSELNEAFNKSLPLPIEEGSEFIRNAFPKLQLLDDKIQWIDSQTTEILNVLLPVVQDTELPSWLGECKWAIEGAFKPPTDPEPPIKKSGLKSFAEFRKKQEMVRRHNRREK